MTQNSLGNTLRTLGLRETGTVRLEQAVVAHESALLECTRDRVPWQWARIQGDLGNTLGALGNREGGTERLEQAVTATELGWSVYRDAGNDQYDNYFGQYLAEIRGLIANRANGLK